MSGRFDRSLTYGLAAVLVLLVFLAVIDPGAPGTATAVTPSPEAAGASAR